VLRCCGNAVLQSEERIAHGPERTGPGVKSFKRRKKDQDERLKVGGKEVLQCCCNAVLPFF